MKKMSPLVITLVVLLGILFLQMKQHQEIMVSEPALTLQVNPGRVSKLSMERPGEPLLTLKRISGGWRIAEPFEYEAQGQLIETTLKQLEELKLDEVVSTNPAKRGKFQVDSTGTHVVAWEGNEKVLDVVVGKASSNYSHTYVRPSDGSSVYRAQGVLTYSFSRKADDWRDKTILSIDQASIKRINLKYPKDDKEVSLVHADTLWSFNVGDKASEADSATVAQFLRNISSLMTEKFVSAQEAASQDFSAADFTLQVETDSKQFLVEFFNVDDNRYFAKSDSHQNVIFLLYKNSMDNLMKHGEDFGATGS